MAKKKPGIAKQEFAPAVAIDELRPFPGNPRQGDIGAICESITANQFYGAVIAQQSTGNIIAGNHRWEAARQSGLTHLPVIWLDVTDEQARKLLVADNRLAEKATWDMPGLATWLQGIISDSGSLDGTGYDGDELDEMIADLGNTQIEAEPGEAEGDHEPRSHICPNCQYEFQD